MVEMLALVWVEAFVFIWGELVDSVGILAGWGHLWASEMKCRRGCIA